MPPVELLGPRVRNLYQEVKHGRIFPLVHTVYPVLASGSAGGRALPRRLAHYLAVAHPGHRSARCIRTACRVVFPASAGSAWPARDLSHVTSQRWGNLGVNVGIGSFLGSREVSGWQLLTLSFHVTLWKFLWKLEVL